MLMKLHQPPAGGSSTTTTCLLQKCALRVEDILGPGTATCKGQSRAQPAQSGGATEGGRVGSRITPTQAGPRLACGGFLGVGGGRAAGVHTLLSWVPPKGHARPQCAAGCTGVNVSGGRAAAPGICRCIPREEHACCRRSAAWQEPGQDKHGGGGQTRRQKPTATRGAALLLLAAPRHQHTPWGRGRERDSTSGRAARRQKGSSRGSSHVGGSRQLLTGPGPEQQQSPTLRSKGRPPSNGAGIGEGSALRTPKGARPAPIGPASLLRKPRLAKESTTLRSRPPDELPICASTPRPASGREVPPSIPAGSVSKTALAGRLLEVLVGNPDSCPLKRVPGDLSGLLSRPTASRKHLWIQRFAVRGPRRSATSEAQPGRLQLQLIPPA